MIQKKHLEWLRRTDNLKKLWHLLIKVCMKHKDWLLITERGLLVLDAVAEGISGHAARNEGVNALYIALDDIQMLRSYTFGKVSPIMGKVHLNVTQINAGTAHNVIPDRCTFVVDIRPTEQHTILLGEKTHHRHQAGGCRSQSS